MARNTEVRAIALTRSLAAAGFAATALSFGPARMGFGLFVPEFRDAFGLSSAAVGGVSGLGFAGFLGGLLAAPFLLDRYGPGAPVLTGLAAAVAGLALVALAPGLPVLAAGVALAASSAGLSWTPFNDPVHRMVEPAARPAVLSRISSGTALGIAAAGLVALGMVGWGIGWRACWAVFALMAVLVLILNWWALRPVGRARTGRAVAPWRLLRRPEAGALMATAMVYGTSSGVFIAFAADRFAAGDGPSGLPGAAIPALVFIVYGLSGLSGLLAGRLEARFGLRRLVRGALLAGALSAAFAGLLPDRWVGLVAASGLQGVHVMMTSALLAIWSERLFPTLPASGFTAALLAMAAGNVLGPVLAGLAAGLLGAGPMFLACAALPGAAALLMPAVGMGQAARARRRPA